MQVEKQDDKSPRTELSLAADFQKAVQQLWDTHVRADLIYNKKLRFCKPCICFFYLGEPGVDHPAEDTYQVHQFFTEASITSPIRLATYLWGLYLLTSGFPTNFSSFFTTKHQPKQLTNSSPSLAPQLASIQAQAQALQGQVAELGRRLEESEAEKAMLQQENEEIMGELLKSRIAAGLEIARISRLAHQISALCHQTCCCREENRD
jgi:hypothetical protein